jgi:flavin-dependent dehydrogenase
VVSSAFPPEEPVDVIVIGGGHNGLTCACYLAGEGLEVTVLERGPELGGCLYTLNVENPPARLEKVQEQAHFYSPRAYG